LSNEKPGVFAESFTVTAAGDGFRDYVILFRLNEYKFRQLFALVED
jgi:hypothetical protein